MSQYEGPPEPGQYGNHPGQSPNPYPGYGQQPTPAGQPNYGYGQQSPQYGAPLAPPMPGGTHVDPETGLVIPNGTEVASVGIRIGAFFLAWLLAIVTLGIGYAIWGLIEWNSGRTPVQRVLGLRCYRNNEFRTLSWGDMLLREFVYWACGIVWPVDIANFIVFLVTSKRQGFHDMASNCIVLRDPDKVLG